MEQDTQIRNNVYFFVAGVVGYAAISVFNSQWGLLSLKMITLVHTVALSAMIWFGLKIFNEYQFENKYFKFIFSILMIYSVIIIIRGVPSSFQLFKGHLFSDYILWPYLIPLVVFLDKSSLTLYYFIKSFFFLGIAFILISLVNPALITMRVFAEPFIHAFAFTCGFLLMNLRYVSKKASWVAFVSLLIGVLSFTYLARRNAILSYACLIMAGSYFFLLNLRVSKFIRLLPVFLGIFIIVLSLSGDAISTLTGKITERLREDTRSIVFDAFFLGMQDDMVYGKGMNGSYYCPFSDAETEDGISFTEVEYRSVIENGYLQLLLNGGYVYIVLFVLTMLPAVLLGLFKSNNHLTRACAIIIALWMVDMAVYGMPRLILQYILVWMCVGICYKQSFRDQTDEEVSECFEAVGLS